MQKKAGACENRRLPLRATAFADHMGRQPPLSQSSPECALDRAPANVLGVLLLVTVLVDAEAK